MIYDILNLVVLASISWSFFVDHQKLDTIDIVILIVITFLWIIPRIVMKPHRCVSCQLEESKPERSNFTDGTTFLLARNMWRTKRNFLNRLSQDILQDISQDLFIVHEGVTIKLVGLVESYALQIAQNMQDETGEYHQVSTFEKYLQYFEGEMDICDE